MDISFRDYFSLSHSLSFCSGVCLSRFLSVSWVLVWTCVRYRVLRILHLYLICTFVRIFLLRQSFHITVIYNYYKDAHLCDFFLSLRLCVNIFFLLSPHSNNPSKFSAFSLLFASELYLLYLFVLFLFFFRLSKLEKNTKHTARKPIGNEKNLMLKFY